MARKQYHLVAAEWRKIRYRLLRYGADTAAKYVVARIQSRTIPTALCLQFVESLLKRDEFSSAGRVFQTMKSHDQAHPLVDEIYSSWLWCIGRKDAALSFALKAAKKWNRSYLYTQVAALYALRGDLIKEHHYRKQASELALKEGEK